MVVQYICTIFIYIDSISVTSSLSLSLFLTLISLFLSLFLFYSKLFSNLRSRFYYHRSYHSSILCTISFFYSIPIYPYQSISSVYFFFTFLLSTLRSSDISSLLANSSLFLFHIISFDLARLTFPLALTTSTQFESLFLVIPHFLVTSFHFHLTT